MSIEDRLDKSVLHLDEYRDKTKENEKKTAFITAAQALKNMSPPNWLIQNTFERGCDAALIASSGSGKSFLVLWWAACIASGMDWMEKKTKKGAVVYFCGEGFNGLVRRLEALRREGYPVDESPIYILPHSADLYNADTREMEKALATIPHEIAAIFIDTLHANSPGLDENSNQAMGVLIDKIRRIKQSAGNPSMIIVHHTGWENDRARGASSFKAALDTEFFMKKEDDVITIRQTKNKDGEASEPLTFEIKPVDIGMVDEYGKAITSAVLIPTEVSVVFTDNAKILYDAISELSCGFADAEIPIAQVREAFYKAVNTKNKSQAFNRAVESLEKSGRFNFSSDNVVIFEKPKK
jgi:hypothetical protein